MATRAIHLQANFGASYASTAASQIYFRVVSHGGTERIARTNAGVEAGTGGSFFVAPTIDDAWLPARIEWDDGGAAGLGAATKRPSAAISNADQLTFGTGEFAGDLSVMIAGVDSTRDSALQVKLIDMLTGFTSWSVGATASEIAAALAGKKLTYQSPVLEDNSILIEAGDDYTHPSRRLEWTIENWTGPSVNGVTAELRFLPLAMYDEFGDQTPAIATFDLSLSQSGTTVSVIGEPTREQTLLLWPATHAGGKAIYQAKAIIPRDAWDEAIEWSLFRVRATVNRPILL